MKLVEYIGFVHIILLKQFVTEEYKKQMKK